MIIVGYQGIGKSTCAKKHRGFIDLESSNFWIPQNGTVARDKEWYKPYCNIAMDIDRQNYVVFVSSHEPVRKYLMEHTSNALAIVPSEDLKDEWIDKLYQRYRQSGLEKDFKAFANANDSFIENIREIKADMPYIELKSMDYSLFSHIMRYKTGQLKEQRSN